jgi:hypothetical protein
VKISEGGAAIYRLRIELLDIGSLGNLVGNEVSARKTMRKEAVLMYICRNPLANIGLSANAG